MNQKTVFLTGATGGIGHALAHRLARQGHTLILQGKTVEKLEALADELVNAGYDEPVLMPLDFTQATVNTFEEIANAVLKEFGHLSALIHCAASLGAVSPIEQQTPENLRTTWLINTFGPLMLTRALSRPLRAAGTPRVVFTTDSHVENPGPFWGGYGVSKAAIDHFARMLANEWDFAAIHTIVPGAVDSPLRQKTHPGEAKTARTTIDAVADKYLALLTS